MKRSMLIISLLCAASAVCATLIEDDFNRSDTSYSADGSLIGPNWTQDSAVNTWKLLGTGADKSVYQYATEAPAVLYNNVLETTSGGGSNFTLKLDVAARRDIVYQGVVWNYQDKDNFYVFRFKENSGAYQVLANVAGSWDVLAAGNAPAIFTANRFFTLKVASSNAYTFTVSAVDSLNGTVMLAPLVVTDTNSRYTGGYAGLYANDLNGERSKYDNFSLEVIPESATIGLIGICATGALFIRRLML